MGTARHAGRGTDNKANNKQMTRYTKTLFIILAAILAWPTMAQGYIYEESRIEECIAVGPARTIGDPAKGGVALVPVHDPRNDKYRILIRWNTPYPDEKHPEGYVIQILDARMAQETAQTLKKAMDILEDDGYSGYTTMDAGDELILAVTKGAPAYIFGGEGTGVIIPDIRYGTPWTRLTQDETRILLESLQKAARYIKDAQSAYINPKRIKNINQHEE